MNNTFKKIAAAVAVLCVAAASLTACTTQSGGAPSSTALTGSAASATSEAAGSGTASSADAQSKTGENVSAWLANEKVWSNSDIINADSVGGSYGTGYYLFDIDLDGEKELIAQLGGGSMGNCVSIAYKLNGGKVSEVYDLGNPALSISVENLSEWKGADGNSFFTDNSTIKVDAAHYLESWSKLTVSSESSEELLFSKAITYSDNSETAEYFIGSSDKAVSQKEFDDAFSEYFNKLTAVEFSRFFIPGFDWVGYSDAQKAEALVSAYKG